MNWISGAIKIIPLIITAVEAVERLFFNKDGENSKKDAAMDIIGQAIESIESLAGKELMNQAEFKVIVSKLIDDYVAVQNFIADFQKHKS